MPPFHQAIRTQLLSLVSFSPQEAVRFFKMQPGQYGAHDQFLGVKVPSIRKIAQKWTHLSCEELAALLASPFNEERLLALFILIQHYQKGDDAARENIAAFYLENRQNINNWNLVDSSAHLILGRHLYETAQEQAEKKEKNMLVLKELASSPVLWSRRIAIVATGYMIRNDVLEWTFTIAPLLLSDPHDLIQKATGWMLKECGKKDPQALEVFTEKHLGRMTKMVRRYCKRPADGL